MMRWFGAVPLLKDCLGCCGCPLVITYEVSSLGGLGLEDYYGYFYRTIATTKDQLLLRSASGRATPQLTWLSHRQPSKQPHV